MIWSENKWTVISALAAILAVIIPMLIFVLSRDSKEITVKTISHAVVVDFSEPALSSFKLTYNNVAVTRLTAATIEVRNSGTRPIERADFERDFVLRFSDSVPILAARVAERVPGELLPELNVSSTRVAIKPLLLNPGDWFRLTVHLHGHFTEPVVEARISGLASIQRRMFINPMNRRMALKLIMGVLALANYFVLLGYSNPFRKHFLRALPHWNALLIAFILLLVGHTLLIDVYRQFELSPTATFWATAIITLLISPLFIFAIRRAQRTAMRLQKGHDATRLQPPAA